MKAITISRYLPVDDPECFVELELPTPEPRGNDLLVRVRAVSVNPVDTQMRAPRPGAEPEPRILGWDAAGVVEAVGERVSRFRPGDEVYYAGSIDRPGSNATYQLVDERIVGPKPASLDYEEAAALPLTAITAWEALFDRARISRDPAANAGRTMLVIGGAGGVGSIAIQIAKRVAGLRVVATASRPESVAWAEEMGADLVIDHSQPFGPQLGQAGVGSVEYVLCTNSLDQHFAQIAALIAPQGTVCAITSGRGGEPIDIRPLFQKSVTFAWELMFTRPLFQTADMAAQHELLAEVARLVDAGVLRTTLAERLGPLSAESLRLAHGRLETGRMIGKLALGGIAG